MNFICRFGSILYWQFLLFSVMVNPIQFSSFSTHYFVLTCNSIFFMSTREKVSSLKKLIVAESFRLSFSIFFCNYLGNFFVFPTVLPTYHFLSYGSQASLFHQWLLPHLPMMVFRFSFLCEGL